MGKGEMAHKRLWEKEKWLSMSHFSFSQSVFKRPSIADMTGKG